MNLFNSFKPCILGTLLKIDICLNYEEYLHEHACQMAKNEKIYSRFLFSSFPVKVK